jgi:hypothetical protein
VTRSLERALVGAWRLQRWEILQPDGSRREPFGRDARGLLLYTADGWMSATIMAAHRRLLSHRNPRLAPEAERAAAFDGYFSYGGRWRVADGAVHHEVTVALNPAMIGTLQVREVRLGATTLTLAATERIDADLRRHRITWRRPPRPRTTRRTPERHPR